MSEFNMEAGIAALADIPGLTSEERDYDGDIFDTPADDTSSETEEEQELSVTSDDEEPETEEEKPVTEAKEPTAKEKSEDSPAPDGTPTDAPKTWRKDAAAEWAALSPTVKAEILKREEDMYRGLEGYKQEATVGRNVGNILSPYLPELQRRGIDPGQNLQVLLQFQHTLQTGTPDQKLGLLQQIAQEFGVSLGDADAGAYSDPAVSALRRQVEELTTAQQQHLARQQEAERTRIASEIDAFASDPKNIYYNDVADDMAKLIRAGVATNLTDAYAKAIGFNVEVKAKEQARLLAEHDKQKVAEAKKAQQATAANLKTSQRKARQTTSPRTIDDTLKDTLRSIREREST